MIPLFSSGVFDCSAKVPAAVFPPKGARRNLPAYLWAATAVAKNPARIGGLAARRFSRMLLQFMCHAASCTPFRRLARFAVRALRTRSAGLNRYRFGIRDMNRF
jgi:hypothetical protein